MPSPSLTLLRTQTDERLAALARDGHERAFEAIVERHRKPLLRAARRVLPEGRAEDALQQALLAAWTALQRGDEVRELRPWLYRIVHHTALNALRVSGYDYAELHEAARIADAGEDELERRAVVRQTLASLAALPDRQREALIRTAVSGDSQEEVARDLGLTDNALRQLVHRARMSMRAAATALTPMPLVTAAASGSARGGSLVERVSELVAGGGASVTLAKAGTVAVLAGSAISGPAIVDHLARRPAGGGTVAAAAATRPPQGHKTAARAKPRPTSAPVMPVSTPVATAEPSRQYPRDDGTDRQRATRRAEDRTRRAERDDSGSGSRGPSGSGDDESGHGDSTPSGSGHTKSGGEDDASSGSSGSADDDSGRDGPSEPAEPAETPQPTETPEAESDHHGSGSSGGDDPEPSATPEPDED
jgi:RNA polymerase sigma factor (sigma-70 family)